MVMVAPGVFSPEPNSTAPEMTVCGWHQVSPGKYVPVPETQRMARVTDEMLTALGMPAQKKTLRRLARAGFIEMLPIAPHTWALNIDSWFGHLRRVAEDCDFWEAGRGNLEEYRKALA